MDPCSPVLLVSEHFPPDVGGSAVLFGNVYSRLDVDTIVLTDPRTSPAHEGRDGRFDVRHVPLRTNDWGIVRPAALRHHGRVALRITATVRETDAVVHCGRALPEGVAAWLAGWIGGGRFLCWAHGEDVATAATSRELTFVMQRVYRAARAVLANSRNTAAELGRLGVPATRIHVAHPGVDTSRFHPGIDASTVRRRYAREGEFLLLSVGRLQRRKGHDLVIEALARLLRVRSNVRYLVVGVGEEEPRLRQLARDLGVADRVEWAGQVSDAELPAFYAACDVFVLPNRREQADLEGFGIVFLEAQATGRAVVGGRSGGVPESVAEGETGLLVEGTDATELADALERLASNVELCVRLGVAGRERTTRKFSWHRTAEIVARVHRDVGGQS